MKDVDSIAQKRGVAFLEAPTGFGKTVSLLVACLPLKYPVFYASRTHSQMAQVVFEAKKIAQHGFTTTAVVLGSRNQLCLDKKLRQTKSYVKACEECLSRLVTRKGTKTYETLTEYDLTENKLTSIAEYCVFDEQRVRIPQKDPPHLPPIMSIRDLREYGKANKVCPYYLAHRLAEKRQLVVGSYNYLFLGFPLSDRITILDEAHNIEELCKNQMSTLISEQLVKLGLANVRSIKADYTLELEKFLDKVHKFLRNTSHQENTISSRKQLLMEMSKCGIGTDLFSSLPQLSVHARKLQRDLILKRRRVIIQESMPTFRIISFFRSFLEAESERHVGIWREEKGGKELEWYCLDASLGFSTLQKQNPIAIVLTSGTLSPIKGQAFRLGVPKAFCKSYSAIVPTQNILLLVLDRGPEGVPLTTRFNLRNQVNIITQYGKTLIEILRRIPNGTLVFFPSYGFMHYALQVWREGGLKLDDVAQQYVELQTGEVSKVVDAYKKTANESQAVLHAVVRGKLSEGYNFPDKEGRGVVILGIPYPDYSDPKIQAQIEYYDSKRKGLGTPSRKACPFIGERVPLVNTIAIGFCF